MTRYEQVIRILDASIGGSGSDIGAHGPFWRGLTRDQFVAKTVFNRPLVVVGDSAASNLVKALKGETPFGVDLPAPPPGARFSRMPAALPPVADADIAFIARWIDDGCPADVAAPTDPTQPREPQPSEDPQTEPSALRWRPTNAPVASSRTDDIWFLDPDVGWAVNSNGQIVHTTDGGETWTEQLHDPDVYFRCVGFASPSRGWAGTLTAARRLFETSDGKTWKPTLGLPPLAPSAICGLSVVNESVAYAAGTNFPNRPPRMMKTVDGGRSWTAWEMRRFADILIDTYFTTPLRGWVVGGKTDEPTPTRANVKPVVLFTEDGGVNWVNRVADLQAGFPRGEWGWKIYFRTPDVGFVSLENFNAGAILTTTDGGKTWTRRPVNDPQGNANLEGIGFVDAKHGWVGGWGDASFERLSSSETFDGGLTWRDANEIGKALNRFRFFGDPVTVGYASGETVYKYSAAPDPRRAVALAPRRGRLLHALDPLIAAGPVSLDVTVPAGASRLTVRIWDRFGDGVRTLVDETRPAPGRRTLTWDRADDAGQVRPSGYFIWRVTVDGASESRLVQAR
jgi:photosystem II stability/assembly factor-like uncharacterized protein